MPNLLRSISAKATSHAARPSFGDLVTAWKSTRIPNIEMFVHVKRDAFILVMLSPYRARAITAIGR
jgi:hypothetical protein